jgi:hypothetical protein
VFRGGSVCKRTPQYWELDFNTDTLMQPASDLLTTTSPSITGKSLCHVPTEKVLVTMYYNSLSVPPTLIYQQLKIEKKKSIFLFS